MEGELRHSDLPKFQRQVRQAREAKGVRREMRWGIPGLTPRFIYSIIFTTAGGVVAAVFVDHFEGGRVGC